MEQTKELSEKKQCDIHVVRSSFKKGKKFETRDNSYIKVMAFEEGYVMARRKGCMPFAKSTNEFIKMIKANCY